MRPLGWLVALVLAGCATASGPPASLDEAACARADANAVVSLTASLFFFDVPCLIVPANRAFAIHLENDDPAEHNVTVYPDASRADELFHGDLITGPGRSIDYALDPLAPGEFWFDCYLHPTQMSGVLLVR